MIPATQDYSDQWILPAVGAGVGIGVDSERDAGLQEGDLVKFDCGTTVGGYRGDGGRTFVYGKAEARRRPSLRSSPGSPRQGLR